MHGLNWPKFPQNRGLGHADTRDIGRDWDNEGRLQVKIIGEKRVRLNSEKTDQLNQNASGSRYSR